MVAGATVVGLGLNGLSTQARAQSAQPKGVLFENVRIFDGVSDKLSAPMNVLVVGNLIKLISAAQINVQPEVALTTERLE